MPSDEELAGTAAVKLGAALGAEVHIGAVQWRLFPSPAVMVQEVSVASQQPITFKSLVLYPDLRALLSRQIKFKQATLAGAVVPQMSLRSLGTGSETFAGDDGRWTVDALPLARLVFSDVTWISRRGIPVIYEGEVDFDVSWRPRAAVLRRPGVNPPAELLLTRSGDEDRWAVDVRLGGGTVNGAVSLQELAGGHLKLTGRLKPDKVEISAALAAFNRRPTISGLASGDTTLSAEGGTVLNLAQSLNTKTPFVMGPGKLLRFDLDKAVRTLGKDHTGQTPLDSVTGLLETQNTPEGMVSYFRDIRAKSGSLSASGNAKLFNRHIDAELAVDLVDGIVGVPLRISGPTTDVKVSVPPGAVAGAVVGTAVLPGIGTAIGARIGATLGKLFGPATGASAPKSSTPPGPTGRKAP
ncbi:MAG: hypothetical protein V4451_15410 [Pseudomonadota bacterium]